MTSQYRHRRSSTASTVFPTLEPGEIAVNTANRQLAVGDAASGTAGAPLPVLPLRFFDTRAQYAAGDMVYQAGVVYRAKSSITPGAFNVSQWDMLVGAVDPQYVEVAGDTMLGALNLPAANPTAGTHATHKTYVDTLIASKSTIYASITPPAGVPDNSIWMETDTGVAYFKYNDGDSTQWIVLSPQIDTTLFVLKSGDTMGGPLNVVHPPTAPNHAASKAYVDTRATVISSDTPPPAPIDNTLWFETDTGLFFIRFNDGTSAQWCAIAAQAGDAVRYDVAQSLTSTQQAQARSNINVTKKNYIINGGMMISQENGTTNGVVNGYYPVDNFAMLISSDATFGTAQSANPTPGGSPYRFRFAVATADTSIAAGQYAFIRTYIEGLRLADLRFGNAQAKNITIQFGVKAPAGTYGLTLRNTAGTRCYIAEYIITAADVTAGDVIKSVTIPGCTDGAWVTDNTNAMWVEWWLATGSTSFGTVGSWQTVNNPGSPNQFNLLGTTTNAFELFDVSLTEGSVAPPFQLPDYAQELVLCQRYWQKGFARSDGSVTAASIVLSIQQKFVCQMRAVPVIAQVNTANPNVSVTPTTMNIGLTEFSSSRTSAGSGGYAWTENWTANARL